MDFREWAARYGLLRARKQFKLSDHMVFVVHGKRYVSARCGDWRACEPLFGQNVTHAKERLRKAVNHSFVSEETIIKEK